MGTVLPGRQTTFASISFKDDVPLVIAAETRTQSLNHGLGRLDHLCQLGHLDLGQLGLVGLRGDRVVLALDLDPLDPLDPLDLPGREVGGLEVPVLP